MIAEKAKQLDALRRERKELRTKLEAMEIRISHLTNQLVSELRSDSRTTRQEQVLGLVRAGKQNKEIGVALNMATSTAKFHVTNLLKKYGVRTRYDL